MAEIGDDVLGHPVAEILLLRIAAHVDERQDQYTRLAVRRGCRGCLRAGRDIDGHRGPGIARNLAAHVGHQRLPARIASLAVPAGQIGGLRQFEHDRAGTGRDRHWQQRAVAIGRGRFRADPARGNGARRPQHHHGAGFMQRGLGDLVVGIARSERGIPPDGQPLGLEPLGIEPRGGLVLRGYDRKIWAAIWSYSTGWICTRKRKMRGLRHQGKRERRHGGSPLAYAPCAADIGPTPGRGGIEAFWQPCLFRLGQGVDGNHPAIDIVSARLTVWGRFPRQAFFRGATDEGL